MNIECINFIPINFFPDLQHIMWKKRGKAHSFTFTNTCKFSFIYFTPAALNLTSQSCFPLY